MVFILKIITIGLLCGIVVDGNYTNKINNKN